MNPITLRHLEKNDQQSFEEAFERFPKEGSFEFLPEGLVPGTWLFALKTAKNHISKKSRIRPTLQFNSLSKSLISLRQKKTAL